MAKPQTVAGDQSEGASYERELADYLQKRIKPGLNSGAIPLLARSIAKEIAHQDRPSNGSVEERDEDEDEPKGGADEEPTGEADDDEPEAEADDDVEDESGDDEPEAEADEDADDEADEDEDEDEEDDEDEPEGESDDDEPEGESDADADGEVSDFEADMHDLQAELGEDWILRFSVHGDDAWLTAEKADGSQRIEAGTAEVLSEAVQLLEEGGGRSR